MAFLNPAPSESLSSSRLVNEHVECQPHSGRAAHPNPLES